MLSDKQKKHILVNRDGLKYYTVEGLEKVHEEMLRLLLIIDTIAKENNIPYWIDGGSLIGIVRHKGFIPWDDDLDISLLKKDYLRLIKEISMYCEMHNDVALFYNEPLVEHTCNFFASKKVFSRTQGSCVLVPVKIDIRPVNCIVKNKDNVIENNIYRDTANYIIFGKSYGYMKKTLSHKNEQMDFLEYYNYKYGLVDSGLENVIMVHPYFEFSNTFELTYNDLFQLKMLQFENMLLPVPNNYDYLLKELYGDYMSYPNICHRAPVACQIYQRQLKDNRFNLCLSMFKHTNRGLLYRMRIILVQIRLLGVFEYMKIKIYE